MLTAQESYSISLFYFPHFCFGRMFFMFICIHLFIWIVFLLFVIFSMMHLLLIAEISGLLFMLVLWIYLIDISLREVRENGNKTLSLFFITSIFSSPCLLMCLDQPKIHWTNWVCSPCLRSMHSSVPAHRHCWIIYWLDAVQRNDDRRCYPDRIVDPADVQCR